MATAASPAASPSASRPDARRRTPTSSPGATACACTPRSTSPPATVSSSGEAGGVQFQAPRLLPELRRTTHGRDRCASRRPRSARATDPPVGGVVPALVPPLQAPECITMTAKCLPSARSRTDLFPYRYPSGNADWQVVSPILPATQAGTSFHRFSGQRRSAGCFTCSPWPSARTVGGVIEVGHDSAQGELLQTDRAAP